MDLVTCPFCACPTRVRDGVLDYHDRPGHRRLVCAGSATGYRPPRHRIEWRIERDQIEGQFSCAAAPGEWCTSYCPLPECEEGCASPATHERTETSTCNVVAYLDDCGDDAATHHVGGYGTPVRDGVIAVSFDGECFGWAYAVEAGASSG